MGTAKDKEGKTYKTRSVEKFSTDGKKCTGVHQYSADDGKTWVKAWTDTMTKVTD